MLDTARAAAMSWPPANPAFCRVWTGPPPWNRNGAAPHHERRPAIGNQISNTPLNTSPALAAQRACALALRRAGQLERGAAVLAAVGQHDAATRFRMLAIELREVAA